MGLYESFQTSTKLEVEGVELDLGFAKFLLARAGGSNQKFNAALTRITALHGRALQGNLLPEGKVREILYEVYADFIILKWWTNVGSDAQGTTIWQEGIEDPNGKPDPDGEPAPLLPVTKENVLATLRALPALFMEIKQIAESITYYRQALLDGIAKNS